MIFGIKKNDNFDPYNIFLAIATNIPVQLKTGFVVLGHKCAFKIRSPYSENDLKMCALTTIRQKQI